MERVQGESRASRWLSLTTDDVKHVMTQLVQEEKKLFSFQFPGFGSLYHSHDIQGDPHIPLQVQGYCIGPVAKRLFWHGERGQMNIDRGPCRPTP